MGSRPVRRCCSPTAGLMSRHLLRSLGLGAALVGGALVAPSASASVAAPDLTLSTAHSLAVAAEAEVAARPPRRAARRAYNRAYRRALRNGYSRYRAHRIATRAANRAYRRAVRRNHRAYHFHYDRYDRRYRCYSYH